MSQRGKHNLPKRKSQQMMGAVHCGSQAAAQLLECAAAIVRLDVINKLKEQ